MTIPYTYILKHIPTNLFYYGVRYAQGCSPLDFFVTYFTSSKKIKRLIEEFGENSFSYEIRKTFKSAELARNWECKVLRRMNAVIRNDFLNSHDSYGPPVMKGETHPLYNTGHSEETKQKMRKPHKKLSEKTRMKMSESRKGDKNPCYGKMGEAHPAFGHKKSDEFKESARKRLLENNHMKSPEALQKARNENRKYKWWNNGDINIRSKECPTEGGWIRGRIMLNNNFKTKSFNAKDTIWWNNGINQKRSKTCPGKEWIKGRLNYKRNIKE